jgi:hypothetical protein
VNRRVTDDHTNTPKVKVSCVVLFDAQLCHSYVPSFDTEKYDVASFDLLFWDDSSPFVSEMSSWGLSCWKLVFFERLVVLTPYQGRFFQLRGEKHSCFNNAIPPEVISSYARCGSDNLKAASQLVITADTDYFSTLVERAVPQISDFDFSADNHDVKKSKKV